MYVVELFTDLRIRLNHNALTIVLINLNFTNLYKNLFQLAR